MPFCSFRRLPTTAAIDSEVIAIPATRACVTRVKGAHHQVRSGRRGNCDIELTINGLSLPKTEIRTCTRFCGRLIKIVLFIVDRDFLRISLVELIFHAVNVNLNAHSISQY
ncbi:hypothetical protein BCEP4_130070 [Burkholderia cepacia]|nr:hypothetical protein BCEP4_130070 [Burkholderia cepacia]